MSDARELYEGSYRVIRLFGEHYDPSFYAETAKAQESYDNRHASRYHHSRFMQAYDSLKQDEQNTAYTWHLAKTKPNYRPSFNISKLGATNSG